MSLDDVVKDEMKKIQVFTTAQYNAPVNKKFLESLETYVQVNDAELNIIMVAGAPYEEDDVIADALQQHKIITTDYRVNNNLQVGNFRVKPQQINPLTGLKRFIARDISTIVGATKQDYEYVGNNKPIKKFIGTTGAVTLPHYNEKTRQGQFARRMHEYGAIVVELINSNKFHIRPFKAQVNGRFDDLRGSYQGLEYSEEPDVAAIIPGDTHHILIDPKVYKTTTKLLEQFPPQRYFVDHDIIDGGCISHHNVGRSIASMMATKEGGFSLEDELKATVKSMMGFYERLPEGVTYVVPAANHNEHVARWVQESRYVGDDKNAVLGHEMFLAMSRGEDPLEFGLKKYGLPDDVLFLSRDDDLRVRGFELARHGDVMQNGSRGSPNQARDLYNKVIKGHTHTPSKKGDVYTNGTSTLLRLAYNSGDSNWVHTHTILYESGLAQHVNIVDGKYML